MLQPLDRLLSDALEMTTYAAAERGVAVINVGCSRRLVVGVDGLLLERVLTNLLVNAVKYSHAGGVVHVRLLDHSGGVGAWAELVVRDDGVGMTSAHRRAVLATQATVADGASGFGLTLPASRAVVEAAGGSLTLTSAPGRGTDVRLRLPLSPDAA